MQTKRTVNRHQKYLQAPWKVLRDYGQTAYCAFLPDHCHLDTGGIFRRTAFFFRHWIASNGGFWRNLAFAPLSRALPVTQLINGLTILVFGFKSYVRDFLLLLLWRFFYCLLFSFDGWWLSVGANIIIRKEEKWKSRKENNACLLFNVY